MKITGLTRRVDSLGRIVIPKELRRMLHIKEGSPLEIYMDADETIVLKKYSQVGSLKNISQAYAQSLSKVTGAMVCVADRDEIIAAAGKNHKNYIGKALSKELENIMDKRKSVLYSKKDDTLIPVVKDDKADCEAQAIAVIVHDGDSAGALYCVFTMKKPISLRLPKSWRVQQQNFWLTSLARDSKKQCKNYLLDYNSNKDVK